MARQNILDRTGAPQLWSILDEGVLNRAIGGPKVMRSQLYRLVEVTEDPRTTIQVIPFCGAHAGLLAHFVIADLDSAPPVAYLETAAEGIVTDSSSAVNRVALRFDRLRAEAESRSASRDLIKKVAEEQWT
jgi:hypothetical protein